MKVAAVLDCYTVALNQGAEHGVDEGMIFAVSSGPIIDPETGENLGEYEKLRVKVTEVYPRFCVAETYRLIMPEEARVVTINIGDDARQWRAR